MVRRFFGVLCLLASVAFMLSIILFVHTMVPGWQAVLVAVINLVLISVGSQLIKGSKVNRDR